MMHPQKMFGTIVCGSLFLLPALALISLVHVQGLSSAGRSLNFQQRARKHRSDVIVFSNMADETESLPAFTPDFDLDDDDNGDVDIPHSFLGSPLTQIWSEEDEEALGWYPGSFSRKANWLEEATEDVLNLENLPVGTLTEEGVESITGLMEAWVRRRSLEAALSVEKLLKRVVDDLRAGNTDIRVTTRMYTIVSSTLRCDGQYEEY